MNKCQLLLSTSVIALLALLGNCTSNTVPPQGKTMPPGQTIGDGLLSFTVWGQQTVGENPRRYLVSLDIEHTGKSGESVSLKRVSMKLTKIDRTEQTIEQRAIDVDSGVCLEIPSESELSKLEIEAEDSGRKYGPFIYDVALNKSSSDNQTQTSADVDAIDVSTTELQVPKGKQCFIDTSLGCLYQIGKMTVEKIAKTTTDPKNFVVLSFKGKGVLQFNRKEFMIVDAGSNDSYQWSHWGYGGEMMLLPGASGSFKQPDNGPVWLRDCWHFQVFYEVPASIRHIKLDFKRASKTNGTSS